MTKIAVVIGSNRQGRGTPKVANWVMKTAQTAQSETEFELVDIADYELPFMTEPQSPQGNPDRHPEGEVKRWLDTLGSAEGFVIVTPEYNHSIPGVLKNAIDQLDRQLIKKPVAIVSHGVMGGARANEHLRLIVNSTLGAVPIPESVTLKAAPATDDTVFDADGNISEAHKTAQRPLESLLASIVWYANVLKSARE
jgi:NAD(P)H-dependent FMN reductase